MRLIGDLHRVRRSGPDRFGVDDGTIPAHYLGTGMLAQSCCHGVAGSVDEQVDRAPGDHVDDDSAVDVAADREVVEPPEIGVVSIGRSRVARPARSSVSRSACTPKRVASRTPAHPVNVSPIVSTSSVSKVVRRAVRRISPGTCSTKVVARQLLLSKKNDGPSGRERPGAHRSECQQADVGTGSAPVPRSVPHVAHRASPPHG